MRVQAILATTATMAGKNILGELMLQFDGMYRVAALMAIPPHPPLPCKNGSIVWDGKNTGCGRLSATELRRVHTAIRHVLDAIPGYWKTNAVVASGRCAATEIRRM